MPNKAHVNFIAKNLTRAIHYSHPTWHGVNRKNYVIGKRMLDKMLNYQIIFTVLCVQRMHNLRENGKCWI